MSILNGLPDDVQQQIDQPAAPAAPLNSGTPAAPPQQAQNLTPPVLDPNPAGTGTLADKISSAYMTHLAQNQPKPIKQDASDYQSTGQRVAGAAGQVAAGFGDAAHSHDTQGGFLSGIANVLNARNQRLDAEQAQKDSSARQQKRDDILDARTQAETVAMHRNQFRQDADTREKGYAGNRDFVNTFAENHDTETVNHDELAKRFTNDKDFANKFYVRATSDSPVFDADGNQKTDRDGNPVTSPMYAIVTKATKDGAPDDKTVSPEMSAASGKFLGKSLPAGTKLTGLQYASIDTSINGVRNSAEIVQNSNGKPLTPEQMKAMSPSLGDPTIQAAVAHVPGSAYAGLVWYQQNADLHLADLKTKIAAAQKAGQPIDQLQKQAADIQAEQKKVQDFTALAIAPKQIDDFNKKQATSQGGIAGFIKDPSKMQGHAETAMAQADDVIKNSQDSAVIAQAQRVKEMAQNIQLAERQNKVDTETALQTAKDKAARVDNNPNGLSGDEYIRTLPVGRANLVKALAQGRLPVNANAFERSTAGKTNPLADDVFAAYPDFNATLGEKWPKTMDQFMISGNDHKKVQAFNVVLNHMKDFYDHTTKQGLFNPGSDDYNKRQIDLNNATREIGTALQTGVLTQSEADEIKNSFDSNKAVTPEMKRVRIQEATHQLGAKINEIQREFDELTPSASMHRTLLSPESKASLGYIMSGGGKQGAQTAPAANGMPVAQDDPSKRPHGTMGIIQGSDNKWYYHDINNKILGPAPDQK